MLRIQPHCAIMHFSPTKKAEYHNLLFNGEEGGISTAFEVEVLAPVSHNFQGSITYEHCSLPTSGSNYFPGWQ